jgi:hypothetical protein
LARAGKGLSWAVAGALGALAVAGAPGPSLRLAAAQAPPPAVHRLPAISANFLPPVGNAAARAQAWTRMKSAGIRVQRMDSGWADIEKTRGVYNWASLDARINEVVQQGFSPLVILDYGNPLYSRRGAAVRASRVPGAPPFGIPDANLFPPDNPGPFAAWAKALAQRYRGAVSMFEVWNEENLGWRFWEPHEDPAAYGALLKAAYKAVKSIAPEDQVAFGGTFYPAIDSHAKGVPAPLRYPAPFGIPHQGTLQFVDNALTADPTLGAYFDALAYHPYHFPYAAPDVDITLEGTTEASMTAVRALLDRHRLTTKPIWITEVGWPNNTSAYGATRDKSASYLVRTYTTAWAHGIDLVVWYTYGDAGDWKVNQESAFGIVDSSGNPKPAYYAWQTLNQLVLSLPYAGIASSDLKLPADGHALRFADEQRRVTVVWLSPESISSDQGPLLPVADQRVQVRTPSAVTAIYDMRGTSLPVSRTFEASPYPVYLVEDRA